MSTRALLRAIGVAALAAIAAMPAAAWKNGPPDNKVTNSEADCRNPPYSTHDWIAEQALRLLPEAESRWLDPHRRLYLIGTEAPDFSRIPAACGTPTPGYDDKGKGRHDLRWADGFSRVARDTPAIRAREEYDKALRAYGAGRPGDAAFYLGAVAHYVGDVSQYGHNVKGERHHADFEDWVGAMTPNGDPGVFRPFLVPRPLVPRGAYWAVIETGRAVVRGGGGILAPAEMDRLFDSPERSGGAYLESVGRALDVAVNEMASVLHAFHRDAVAGNGTRRP